ncbi:glutaminyl-peptide cyclotransferase [Desulfatitalea alkaliphila]|uniref:Glutaminyl-peptide cyclotransferase n=1 Tax=Desulfatitalea alkaliphila TaxID=2929485 RepID=A0AA41UIJ1_9BACT|nr:glutaminyl-peptide cyclotransferase [Desulfatitalea alkaliphila]MCJ8500835.1 glutaminyl-peptide cyclotransferase [Desulfatitalea alkaliphila]
MRLTGRRQRSVRPGRSLILLGTLCGLFILLPACRTLHPAEADSVPFLTPEIIAVLPHDPTAYTQGLLYHAGHLYESTGRYGRSELRRVDPATGKVLQRVRLEDRFFGEGLARVDDRLIQLTWGEKTALVYDSTTFAPLGRFSYEGEGWGLCYDGRHLYRSDGGSRLMLHAPDTFAVVGALPVTRGGRPVTHLNELACVGSHIYANVFLSDHIVQIDKQSGQVSAVIDGSRLLAPRERDALPADAVLNGIAWDPREAVFYLTGKLWPKMFKVRLE